MYVSSAVSWPPILFYLPATSGIDEGRSPEQCYTRLYWLAAGLKTGRASRFRRNPRIVLVLLVCKLSLHTRKSNHKKELHGLSLLSTGGGMHLFSSSVPVMRGQLLDQSNDITLSQTVSKTFFRHLFLCSGDRLPSWQDQMLFATCFTRQILFLGPEE